jgi:iron complex outermembrane receptor protein
MCKVQAQESILDTINIEGVTIYKPKTNPGLQAGVKSITIDTLAFIGKISYSLSELLTENSPIFIKTYGRGATATASFRGTSASHTNVYWNGIKINSPMSGQADFSLIPLYFVDDVAIHFGQSSMWYGNGGLGGSVNLKSSPNWNEKFSAKIYQTLGSYNTYSTAASTSYGSSRLKAQTRLFRELSENNFSYKNIAKIGYPIEIQQNADYLKYGLLQEIFYRPNVSNIVSAKFWAQQVSRGIPPLMSNYSVKEINRQSDALFNSIIEWQKTGEKTSWKASTGFTLLELDYKYSKLLLEGDTLPVIFANSRSVSWYNKASLDLNINNWLSANLLAEINSHWVNSAEKNLESGYSGSQLHSALRASVNVTPTDRLALSILIADELYSNKITPISSSISTKYKLFRRFGIFANGGVSRNFHYPSLNDMFWQPGGNPNLKPEDSFSMEGGIQFISKRRHLSFETDLNIFSSKISNWIMWLPHLKGYWEPTNLNLVEAKGVEIAMGITQTLGLATIKVKGSYSNTQSVIQNAGGIMRPEANGKQIPFIPVHSGGIAFNALWRKFHLVYTFTHYSERYTTTSNNPNSFRRLNPYYMSSAALGKEFNFFRVPLGIQLRIDNLLNESYQTILWRPMPGRNYSITVRADF